MRYPEETKERAREMVRGGASYRRAAAELGASAMAVWGWVNGPRRRGREGRVGRAADPCEPTASGPLAGLGRAEVENLLLRAVLADLKAGGWDPASISNRSKCELGERLRLATGLPLREITAFLRISRSSYEYHRARLGRDKYAALRAEVRSAFEAGRGAYGYRRVHAELRRRGTRVSEKVVRRLMREEGLEARRPRRARHSSYAGEPDERPANLPRERAEARRALGERFAADHDFSAPAPGALAVTDVTEFSVGGRRLYLSALLDCFDGMPAAWRVSGHPDSALCDGTLLDWLSSAGDARGAVVHTDGGGPYRANSWKLICERHGVVRSMSRRGRSGDNARAEGFFGALKTELLGGRDWEGVGAEEFARELDGYIRWYRDGRLKRFEGPGGHTYETIAGRRRRLGLPV